MKRQEPNANGFFGKIVQNVAGLFCPNSNQVIGIQRMATVPLSSQMSQGISNIPKQDTSVLLGITFDRSLERLKQEQLLKLQQQQQEIENVSNQKSESLLKRQVAQTLNKEEEQFEKPKEIKKAVRVEEEKKEETKSKIESRVDADSIRIRQTIAKLRETNYEDIIQCLNERKERLMRKESVKGNVSIPQQADSDEKVLRASLSSLLLDSSSEEEDNLVPLGKKCKECKKEEVKKPQKKTVKTTNDKKKTFIDLSKGVSDNTKSKTESNTLNFADNAFVNLNKDKPKDSFSNTTFNLNSNNTFDLNIFDSKVDKNVPTPPVPAITTTPPAPATIPLITTDFKLGFEPKGESNFDQSLPGNTDLHKPTLQGFEVKPVEKEQKNEPKPIVVDPFNIAPFGQIDLKFGEEKKAESQVTIAPLNISEPEPSKDDVELSPFAKLNAADAKKNPPLPQRKSQEKKSEEKTDLSNLNNYGFAPFAPMQNDFTLGMTSQPTTGNKPEDNKTGGAFGLALIDPFGTSNQTTVEPKKSETTFPSTAFPNFTQLPTTGTKPEDKKIDNAFSANAGFGSFGAFQATTETKPEDKKIDSGAAFADTFAIPFGTSNQPTAEPKKNETTFVNSAFINAIQPNPDTKVEDKKSDPSPATNAFGFSNFSPLSTPGTNPFGTQPTAGAKPEDKKTDNIFASNAGFGAFGGSFGSVQQPIAGPNLGDKKQEADPFANFTSQPSSAPFSFQSFSLAEKTGGENKIDFSNQGTGLNPFGVTSQPTQSIGNKPNEPLLVTDDSFFVATPKGAEQTVRTFGSKFNIPIAKDTPFTFSPTKERR